jgi:transposase-like protein
MAKHWIDRAALADKLLESATSAEDPLRAMAEMIADFLTEAEVTVKAGAERHERSAQRTTHCNGYRDPRRDTRPGTLALKALKLRQGGYVPGFIEHPKRSEQAWVSVIQEAVVRGVSTRKIEAVPREPGMAGVSAGQVRQFRERPLGEIRYVWVDAL